MTKPHIHAGGGDCDCYYARPDVTGLYGIIGRNVADAR